MPTDRPRVVFLGSPAFVVPVLEELASLHKTGVVQLVGVVSQPAKRGKRGKVKHDPAVAGYAKNLLHDDASEFGSLTILQPEKARDQGFVDAFAALKPDIAITAAYGQILSDDFLAVPTRATINIHPSLLPAYRGATPVQSALMDGLKESGVSVLFTVKELDAGNLITQEKLNIAKYGAAHWMDELFRVGAKMLPEAIAKLADPSFVGSPQSHNPLNVEASHCFKIRKSQGKVDWLLPAEGLLSLSKGLELWPGVYGFVADISSKKDEEKKYKKVAFAGVKQIESPPADLQNVSWRPGKSAYSKQLARGVVACAKSSYLSIEKFKPAGSKEVGARDFFDRFGKGVVEFLRPAMPILVGVSGTGRSLRNLLALESERLWSVQGVFSNDAGCKAIRFAKRNGIPTWTGDSRKDPQGLRAFVEERMNGKKGVVCLAGFLQMLPELGLENATIINIHPSLLPSYGGKGMYGMHVHRSVFDNSDQISGATVHLVTPEYDKGEIIGQVTVDISSCSNAEEVADRVFEQEKKLLPQVIDQIVWQQIT